jgi:hypothetical protein
MSDRAGLLQQPGSGSWREDVLLAFEQSQMNGAAGLWDPLRIDPSDDFRGAQRVLLDEGAMEERVRAQLLYDMDHDRKALALTHDLDRLGPEAEQYPIKALVAERTDLLPGASIRSAVDLPHPEGPTRTRNSPSAMSRLSESTAGRSVLA